MKEENLNTRARVQLIITQNGIHSSVLKVRSYYNKYTKHYAKRKC